MSNIKKTIDTLQKGLSLEILSISLKSVKNYKAVRDFFGSQLNQEGTYGKGLLESKGFWNRERTLFVGENRKLESYVLCFFTEQSLEILEEFRRNFLNLNENKEMCDLFVISRLQTYFLHDVPPEFRQEHDYRAALRDTIGLQNKSLPKIIRENDSLYIGGKTGSTILEIIAKPQTDFTVNRLVTKLTVKDRAGENAMKILSKSIEASFKTIVAFLAIQQISRTNLSDLLKYLRKDYSRDYAVGKVVNYAQEKSRATSSHGKYVLRALSGITNKFSKEDTYEEAQEIFLDWLYDLYFGNRMREKILKHDAFIIAVQEIKLLENEGEPPSSSRKRGRKKRGDQVPPS